MFTKSFLTVRCKESLGNMAKYELLDGLNSRVCHTLGITISYS
jgi:hypothetical protein